MNKEEGLIKKYEVRRTDGKPTPKMCFVLASTDPIAHSALSYYAAVAKLKGYAELSKDILKLLDDWKENSKG